MVGRWFKTNSVTKKTNKSGARSAAKYEKELKHVRAKARRMNALKAKQGMKAMKAKVRVVAMQAMKGR